MSITFSAVTTISVTHSAQQYPLVQIVDSNGEVMIPQTLTHNSISNFTVVFGTVSSGTIIYGGGSGPQIVISNFGDNRILTSGNTATSSNAESNLTFDGGTFTVNGTSSLSGHTTFQQTSEVVNTSPGATSSSVIYDFSSGSIWYHATASSNYSANFINMPTVNNRAITATVIISQGLTGYAPTSVRIEGVTQSLKWASGTYSLSSNKVDIIGFTFLRTGNAWSQVFGQISSFS